MFCGASTQHFGWIGRGYGWIGCKVLIATVIIKIIIVLDGNLTLPNTYLKKIDGIKISKNILRCPVTLWFAIRDDLLVISLSKLTVLIV